MTTRKTICLVHGTFNGNLYGYKGWNMEKLPIWNNYLDNAKDFIWQVVPPKNSYSAYMLVSGSGVIYLHPTGFNAVLTSCGVSDGQSYFSTNLLTLYRLCTELAEACGATFELSTSTEQLHDFEKLNTYTL